MVPMHYGSFRSSFEPPDEPLHRLRAAIKNSAMEERVVVMEVGHPHHLLIVLVLVVVLVLDRSVCQSNRWTDFVHLLPPKRTVHAGDG
jgi:hypothetical protein